MHQNLFFFLISHTLTAQHQTDNTNKIPTGERCSSRLQVRVAGSASTNLLFSGGGLGGLRQRWLSISPLDHRRVLFSSSTETTAPSSGRVLSEPPGSSLHDRKNNKKNPVWLFLCVSVWADWAGQTSPSAAAAACCLLLLLLLLFFLFSSSRAAHPRDVVEPPRRYWQPVAIAILQVGYIYCKLMRVCMCGGGKVWPFMWYL